MTTQRLYTVFTALFLLLVGNVQAFWRMECRARSGVARIDPLVANGTVSEHVHVIHGSSGKFSTVPLSHPDLPTSRLIAPCQFIGASPHMHYTSILCIYLANSSI
jgi:hypothetical protein